MRTHLAGWYSVVLCSALMATRAYSQTGGAPGISAEEADAKTLLRQAEETLKNAASAEWDVVLETNQGIDKLFPEGRHAYHFQVRGLGRVHWNEEQKSGGKTDRGEAWYEGFTLYQRTPENAAGLESTPMGEDEGLCVRLSMVRGGVVGWNLVHRIIGGLELGKARVFREERVNDRPAVVIDHEFKLGGICGKYQDFPGCRVWLDSERKLVLQREFHLTFKMGEKQVPFVAREVFSNWKLNPELPDAVFHVEGMQPPDPLADLPQDPDQFEVVQTEKALGVKVQSFPAPQGPEGFDELPEAGPEFRFSMTERPPTDEAPAASYESRKCVSAKTPDGLKLEALCGYADHPDRFPSTRENRRHRYGGGSYHPEDVYVGERVGGKLRPSLFFRDIGSHNTAPHALAVDREGRCFLAVADVDIGQDNRFKLYGVISDPKRTKWTEAWIVDHRRALTSSAKPWCVARGKEVHIVWQWDGGREAKESGLYHVVWTPDGFGRKTRVARGAINEADVAVDVKTGRLLVAYSDEGGIFLSSLPMGGGWTKVTALDPSVKGEHPVMVLAPGDGTFIIRGQHEKCSEWVLAPSPAGQER